MSNEVSLTQTGLVIKRGDSKSYTLYFVDEDGAAIDITGWTVFFTVKIHVEDADVDAYISKTITSHSDPTNGETQIELNSTDTGTVGNYIYDIQYKTDTGEIKTIIEGNLVITQDITQRTS